MLTLTFGSRNMNRSEFFKVLFDQLNEIGPVMKKRLTATVDKLEFFTGKFDPSKVHSYTRPQNTYRGGMIGYTYLQHLSFGALGIDVTEDTQGKIVGLDFEYQVPDLGRYNQPLYKNCISRSTNSSSAIDTEMKLRKFIVSKINSLLDRLDEWYATSYHANFEAYEENRKLELQANPHYFWVTDPTGQTYVREMLAHAAKLRLIAEIHRQRSPMYGVTGAERISEIVNELANEIANHVRSNPNHDSIILHEKG